MYSLIKNNYDDKEEVRQAVNREEEDASVTPTHVFKIKFSTFSFQIKKQSHALFPEQSVLSAHRLTHNGVHTESTGGVIYIRTILWSQTLKQ